MSSRHGPLALDDPITVPFTRRDRESPASSAVDVGTGPWRGGQIVTNTAGRRPAVLGSVGGVVFCAGAGWCARRLLHRVGAPSGALSSVPARTARPTRWSTRAVGRASWFPTGAAADLHSATDHSGRLPARPGRRRGDGDTFRVPLGDVIPGGVRRQRPVHPAGGSTTGLNQSAPRPLSNFCPCCDSSAGGSLWRRIDSSANPLRADGSTSARGRHPDGRFAAFLLLGAGWR